MESEVIPIKNDTILPFPREFLSFLNVFQDCFSKPQFRNFSQICGGLVLGKSMSIRRFSVMFEERDHSSLSKFLTRSPWDENKVKSKFHHELFKKVHGLKVFIGDDTLSEKPFAKKLEGADSHYSNLKKCNAIGHSIVTTGFHTTVGCIPFDSQVYLRKKTAKKLERPFLTKNEIMAQKIDSAAKTTNFEYVVVDSWYSNTTVLGKILQLRKKFVTQIKSNRNITINYSKREARNHKKNIPIREYFYETVNKNLFRVYEDNGFISGLGTVRILFSQMLLKNKDGTVHWSDTHYLITNDFESPPQKIIEIYLQRNSIEFFHREGKQQLGMSQYLIRNIRGIERYLFLVTLVYAILILLNLQLIEKEKPKQTIGQIKTYLREDCYTNLLKNAKIQKIEVLKAKARNLAYALG